MPEWKDNTFHLFVLVSFPSAPMRLILHRQAFWAGGGAAVLGCCNSELPTLAGRCDCKLNSNRQSQKTGTVQHGMEQNTPCQPPSSVKKDAENQGEEKERNRICHFSRKKILNHNVNKKDRRNEQHEKGERQSNIRRQSVEP